MSVMVMDGKLIDKHHQILKKSNAIIDGVYGDLSLGALKMMNVVLHAHQEKGSLTFSVPMADFRKKMHMEKNNHYKTRIEEYLKELKREIKLRDFINPNTGRKVLWSKAQLVDYVGIEKDNKLYLTIRLSPEFVAYMVEKAGYAKINITHNFRTKYAFLIYEMYRRYYDKPNKGVSVYIGHISKTLEELNGLFDTQCTFPSEMMRLINRGTTEITRKLHEKVECTYRSDSQRFDFYWNIDTKLAHENCKIPKKRIKELSEWIASHTKKKIENKEHYIAKLKKLIENGEIEEWEDYYRGMLSNKYKFTKNEIDMMKTSMGFYRDFNNKEASGILVFAEQVAQ